MIFTAIGMIKPAATLSLNGAMYFNGTSTSNIVYNSQTSQIKVGVGDFTVEWYQYQTDSNSAPRIFSMGTGNEGDAGPSVEMAVFIDSLGNFKFLYGAGGSNTTAQLYNVGNVGTYKNQWVHFAITRSSNSVKVFKDGTQIGTTATISYNFNSQPTLRIANESTTSTASAFGGWITNFRWVAGTAVYTSNFSKPTSPLSNISNTKILLLASTNLTATTDTANIITPTASNVTWYAFNANTMTV